MNEIQTKLLEQASDILAGVSNTVSQAKDLAVDQLPGIASQYVAYGMAWSITLTIFFLCTASLVWFFTVKYHEDLEEGIVPVSFIGWALTGATLWSLKTTLLVIFAPKVWLIKEIVDLVK